MATTRSEPVPAGPEHRAGTEEGTSSAREPRELIVVLASLTLVAAVLAWWAWKQGAYFGTVFFPGAIVLFGYLIMLLVAAPFPGRFAGPARVAVAAIIALSGWTLLSSAWTSMPDAPFQDAERELLYATVFGLGLWIASFARHNLVLPLAAVAAVGVGVGIATTVTLSTGTDLATYVHVFDATLRLPIGYRNANAAFFLICLWPLLVLAAEGNAPWQLRALMIGGATMLIELAVLSESRGSLPAAALGLAVFVALAPRRLRAACYLALAAIPVLPAVPALLDVFQHGEANRALIPLLRDAARAIGLSSLGSIVLAAICIRGVELRLNLGREMVRRISIAATVIAAVVVVAGGTAFVVKRGGPVAFINQRVSEFTKGGNPSLEAQGTRFGVNVGTNRGDFWRVALHEGGDKPLLGGGAGSFADAYLRERHSSETPKDPHSVELLMLSELGVAGLALFATFIVAAVAAALRARRLGREAAALVAGSLAAGAYWLVHASYDWFWYYPGLTAPVFFLLGAAGAPSILDRTGGLGRRTRYIGAIVFAAALLIAVPLFLSQRYENRALGEFPGNPAAALSDLNRAADLDPFDPEPLLAEGVIESRLGRDAAAESALRQAIGRQPDGFAGHFFLARVLARTDLTAARAEAREALRLNPFDPQTRALARSLSRARPQR
jgi:hypothetical protein